ncbi:MAG: hypothetical protein K9M49_08950 [Candidatus Marinimicrobia bacterium]|nr:hypothetical protein [Candidatus Neomarinimicrobiota bacterium]MCF7850420.1 hypothetical protein [Candidatus Neomarinimicrobiota bacterium]MCF7905263.1 hypothetical protein [Candidatus Neomarinimicrobiota bacterium]
MNNLRSAKTYVILISIIVISTGFNSCASPPQLLEPAKVTFKESLRAENDNYIGTLEGCIVGKKEKPLKKLVVTPDLEDFINIRGEVTRTDDQGCYSIDLYWKNQPYLLADVYPNPAENSFTNSGLDYLKAARTVSVDIPVLAGKKEVELYEQEVTMYSVSYVLKQIAAEVVNPRLRSFRFAVEDYNTGFPIVGAEVNIRASSSVQPVDSILAMYVSQQNFRDIASTTIQPFITSSETKKQEPGSSMEFIVMSFEDYWLTVTHPQYHGVTEKIYVESNLDKIVRLTPKDQKKRIDIIDR